MMHSSIKMINAYITLASNMRQHSTSLVQTTPNVFILLWTEIANYDPIVLIDTHTSSLNLHLILTSHDTYSSDPKRSETFKLSTLEQNNKKK